MSIATRLDLPEVYAALRARSLKSDQPWGAMDGMKE
jgi:hypothetical protein